MADPDILQPTNDNEVKKIPKKYFLTLILEILVINSQLKLFNKALDFGKKKKKKKVKEDLLKEADSESTPTTLAGSTISPLADKENKESTETGGATTSAAAENEDDGLDFTKIKKKKPKATVKFDDGQNEVIEVKKLLYNTSSGVTGVKILCFKLKFFSPSQCIL